jgi:hypothetical protein
MLNRTPALTAVLYRMVDRFDSTEERGTPAMFPDFREGAVLDARSRTRSSIVTPTSRRD